MKNDDKDGFRKTDVATSNSLSALSATSKDSQTNGSLDRDGTNSTGSDDRESSTYWILDTWSSTTEQCLKQPLVACLVFIATAAASRPGLTIILGFTLAVSLAAIGLATNFYIETDGNVLWIPPDSYPVQNAEWLENESGFPERPRNFLMTLHHANDDGSNILGIDATTAIFDVMDSIRSAEAWGVDGFFCENSHNTAGAAASESSLCPITSATNFWNGNRTLFEEKVKNDQDAIEQLSNLVYPNGQPVYREAIFGLPEPKLTKDYEGDETLTSVTTYTIEILFPPIEDAATFEEELESVIVALNDEWQSAEKEYVVEFLSYSSFDRELIRGITRDIPLMLSAFLIMGCFVAFTLSKRDRVQSQSLLGVGAVVTVFLATLAGYGLLFCIGTPFSSLTQIFPYVMVGIGLDDTFIITGAFARTDPKKSAVDRVADAINDVGISIFVSTLTTTTAFSLGTLTSIPAVRWFALYAAPTVAIDFVYQITFFVALMVYDDQRIKKNRYDCLICCTKSPDLTTENRTSTFDNGGEIEGEPQAEHQENATYVTRFMLWYSEVLLKPASKVTVLIFFGMLLAVGSWGASRQSQDFDFRSLLPSDSFIRSYWKTTEKFGNPDLDNYHFVDVVFRDVDPSYLSIQESMNRYVDDLVDMPYITNGPREYWLTDFNLFTSNETSLQNKSLTFYKQLDRFLSTEPYASLYMDDIVRNEEGVVTASRTTLNFDNVPSFDSKTQVKVYQTQYDITKSQPLNQGTDDWPLFTFGVIFYTWELYQIVVGEVLRTVIVGLIATAIISIIFIPHPIGFMVVTPIVAAIYVELMAVLRLADLYINSVTAVGLIMSIGLVVDYNMHVVLTYFECDKAQNRNERVTQVLCTMGQSILLGALSTLLGVLPLSLSSSEIFWSFFVTFLGIVFLGAGHGLMLMPVLLSLFGPMKRTETLLKEEEEDEDEDEISLIVTES